MLKECWNLLINENKCYIVPEVGKLQETFAPSPSKISRKLRTFASLVEAANTRSKW